MALFKLYCILLTMFGSYNYSKKILTNFENHAKLLFINFGFFSDQFPRLRATSTTPSCFSTPLASRTLPPVDVLPEQPSRRCVTITSRQVLFCFVLFCLRNISRFEINFHIVVQLYQDKFCYNSMIISFNANWVFQDVFGLFLKNVILIFCDGFSNFFSFSKNIN